MRRRSNAGAEGLRSLLERGDAVPVAGVFNPLSALIAEDVGFEALYLSGAALTASLGIPDIGLISLDDLTTATRWITRATTLPLIVDADTGFGGVLNVFRTVAELESAGAAAVQIEDQVMPKRCGHLEGKQVVDAEEFCAKIRAAVDARSSMLVVARTDTKAILGLDRAIQRGRLYQAAGADVVFPEALETKSEFRSYAVGVDVPLLANMTEFGKTPYLSVKEFESLGYQLVIFPVTALRISAEAMRGAMSNVLNSGTQVDILDRMQTRADLYELIGYKDYEGLDRRVAAGAGKTGDVQPGIDT